MQGIPQDDAAWRSLVEETWSALKSRAAKSKSYIAPPAGSQEFAAMVDHTQLTIGVNEDGIKSCCREAIEMKFKVSCVDGC